MARESQTASLASARDQLEAISKGLKYVASNNDEALLTKDVPGEIVAAGNVAIWKKGIVEWQLAMQNLKKEGEETVKRCEAFLAATDTVPVAIYEPVP